ncbi:MAG: HAD family hydrolase [Planctomycetota bacterium]
MAFPDLDRIEALLFDLDGTLYDARPVRRGLAFELLASIVMTAKPWRALRAIRVLRTYRALHEELRGSGPGMALRQTSEAARRTGVPVAEVEAIVGEWMLERPLARLVAAARPGLGALLDAAQARGWRLGCLSDYPVSQKLAALGLTERLSFMACTSDPDIDAPKPSPVGFLAAARAWGLDPERVLYVGDREAVDRAGARAAGMPCVLVGAGPGPDAQDFLELRRRLGL